MLNSGYDDMNFDYIIKEGEYFNNRLSLAFITLSSNPFHHSVVAEKKTSDGKTIASLLPTCPIIKDCLLIEM